MLVVGIRYESDCRPYYTNRLSNTAVDWTGTTRRDFYCIIRLRSSRSRSRTLLRSLDFRIRSHSQFHSSITHLQLYFSH